MGREMHDRIDVVLFEQAIQQGCVTGIADNELARRNGSFETGRQIIERTTTSSPAAPSCFTT